MLINQTAYDNGELLAPRKKDLDSKQIFPGGIPTTDAGFYHRFKFEARTAGHLADKERRFFREMRQVPGFSTLSLRPYQVRDGAFYRTGLDVIYVVETPFTGVR